jgi:DNA-binding IclR family transcriptional regulator
LEQSATRISITSVGSGRSACRAFITGVAFLGTRNLVGVGRPYTPALTNESTETVNLAIEDE